MIQFQGFKPSGIEKIANAMGFQGEEKDFQKFLEDNPDRQAEMMRYQDIARKMVEGGYVKKMQKGGDIKPDDPVYGGPVTDPPKGQPELPKKKATITDITAKRVTDPKLPTGAVVNPYGVPTDDNQLIDPDKSKLGATPTGTARGALTEDAVATPKTDTATFDATTKSDEVDAVNKSIETAQADPNDPRAKVTAQASTKSLVGDLKAAEGVAQRVPLLWT